ncbi:16S rRNA (cytidine(1402)-2'-O)-methyltransferase [Candidatus Falkowbacteria bacterium HGW-Falkowbacteria-2]|uniref:Ribosomal RNA small subunit methyltransferase I n=1 Tax=Candidatus Falkowbacteria bacterium HGW-Falkowbacteria-2 TaxID=2013769 RepID=A0A2N2E2A8_9BACT|nr:MAG: 16S rRNA (cytidine(1402)-2'-O)-methyltransferase [Candidatus Falkowbacteria bacterium HGW-Falkowbacteria-2]
MSLGKLYVAATPIGNLEDISLRALRIMREADYILCEDTRLTRVLLQKHEISTPTISYHQHSGGGKVGQLLRYLGEGKNLVLVSDAGTPGISDPGSMLVASAREEFPDLEVVPLPGASAVIAALSVSGWPVDRFTFFGFLPHKKGRQTMIKEIITSSYPAVFYESKHRIRKCMEEITTLSAEAEIKVEVMLARELTKMFETIYFGDPSELVEKLENDTDMQKGEFVVLCRKVKK